jgi:PAS domain S-box-containing protein
LQRRHDVPVIYLTAHTDTETLDRAKITEPFGYLAKPIGQASLPTSIEVALYKHKIERELRQQRAWLRTTLATLADAVIVVDHCGLVQYLNPAAEALTAWPGAEAVGQPVANVVRLYDPPSGRLMDDLLAGSMLDVNVSALPAGLRLLTRTDDQVPVEGEIAPSTEDGAALGAVLTLRDITRREQEEQEIRHDQKMQAVGRLAAGVAHDFNNLLTVILGHAGLLLNSSGELPEHVRHALEEIRNAGSTAATVTRQLLTFSRNQQVRPELVDLTALVEQNEELCRRSLGGSIVWRTTLERRLKPVFADRGQLAQVLINLVVNAREAMPEGGVVTVTTENIKLDTATDLGPEVEEYVALTVADTGVGMDAKVAEQIFEPFFTTKAAGSGTGLGLSIVHNIVSDLGGLISVDSQPGAGTSFRIFLPASEPGSDERPAVGWSSHPRAIDRSKTILLVDDNDSVRRVMQKYLEGRGYHVLQAADGSQALAVAGSYNGRIDVLVTDVVMPKMNGFRLAQQLTESRPDVKTIFVSGYASNIIEEKSAAVESARFLQKPFLDRDLLAEVEQLFEERSGQPS